MTTPHVAPDVAPDAPIVVAFPLHDGAQNYRIAGHGDDGTAALACIYGWDPDGDPIVIHPDNGSLMPVEMVFRRWEFCGWNTAQERIAHRDEVLDAYSRYASSWLKERSRQFEPSA